MREINTELNIIRDVSTAFYEGTSFTPTSVTKERTLNPLVTIYRALKTIRSFNYISSNTLSPVTYCYNSVVGISVK